VIEGEFMKYERTGIGAAEVGCKILFKRPGSRTSGNDACKGEMQNEGGASGDMCVECSLA
jgi:hypothetical protein